MCLGDKAIESSEVEEVQTALAQISQIAQGITAENRQEFAEGLDLLAAEVQLNAYASDDDDDDDEEAFGD